MLFTDVRPMGERGTVTLSISALKERSQRQKKAVRKATSWCPEDRQV